MQLGNSLLFNNKNNVPENLNSNDKKKEEKKNVKNIEIKFDDNKEIKKIKELNSCSVELILEEKYELALEVLNKLEEVLETNIIDSKYNYDKI